VGHVLSGGAPQQYFNTSLVIVTPQTADRGIPDDFKGLKFALHGVPLIGV